MQGAHRLQPTNNQNAALTSTDKEVRQRLQDALQRFGYKQVDVSKETGSLIRNPSFYALSVAAREGQRKSGEDQRNLGAVAPGYLLFQTPFF